jgi:hypothetical protein
VCTRQCTTSTDCSLGTLHFDADNYACEGGLCRYTGCNSDQECADALGPYVCRMSATLNDALFGLFGDEPVCVQACTDTSTCMVSGGGAAWDGDNHSCTDGGCVYEGCHSDMECGGGQVCRAAP